MFIFKFVNLNVFLAFALILAPPFALAADPDTVSLPAPTYKGAVSVEEALKDRRTCRSFQEKSLTLGQLSQLLWAAYGVTDRAGGLRLKTAPSAGALYPLDVYAVTGAGGINDLAAGVYRYVPEGHQLKRIAAGDLRKETARGALGQMWMAKAPVMLVVAGEYARSSVKYGQRGIRYTHIEAGCVAQNIFLQAEALGLRAGIVGAFDDKRVQKTLCLPSEHDPQVIMPVGYGN